MTYKTEPASSDSVNLGSNPSSPATANADVSGISRPPSASEKSEIPEQTAHTGRTETGTAPNLTPNERKVLGWLARRHSEDFGYYSFAPIMKGVRLPRGAVRLACRSLKRKGLAEFCSGLWGEMSGRPAGSGYAATRTGAALAARPSRSRVLG